MPRKRMPQSGILEIDLQFPANGIEETRAFNRQRVGTCVDGVNVRTFDPTTGRARGGSRSGIQKFMSSVAVTASYPVQQLCSIRTTDAKYQGASAALVAAMGSSVYALASGSGFGVASSAGVSSFTDAGTTGYGFACSCWDDAGNVYVAEVNTTTGATRIHKYSDAGVEQTNFPVTSITVTTGSLRSVCGMVVIGTSLYIAFTSSGSSFIKKIDTTTGSVTAWRSSSQTTNMVFSTAAVSCLGKVGKLLGVVCRASSNAQCFKIIDTTKANSTTPISVALTGTGAAKRATCVSDGLAFFYCICDRTTNQVAKIGIGGTLDWNSTEFDSDGIQGLCYDTSLGELVGVTTANNRIRTLSLTTGVKISGTGTTSYNWIDSDNSGNFTVWIDGTASNDTTGLDSTFSTVWGPTTRANTTHSGASMFKGVLPSPSPVTNAQVRLLGVSNGTLFRADSTGPTAVTNGAVFSATDDAFIANAQQGLYLYLSDGATMKYYNPALDSVVAWTASAGSLPKDSLGSTPRLLCNFLDRMVASGLRGDPRSVFLSATADATDWDYSPAVESATQAFALAVKDVVNTLIPHKDDVLVIGCDHTIMQLTGDPGTGGQFDVVTDSIGMAWNAWCFDPVGQIYFFGTRGGIWKMQPGTAPIRVSQQIERRLAQIDLSSTRVNMVWDFDNHSLEIFCVPFDVTQAGTKFCWEDRTNAWWVDSFANVNHWPTSVLLFDGPTADDRAILFGCRDGYIRRPSNSATMDDGTDINSSVTIGPLPNQMLDELILHTLQATLGDASGDVSYNVLVGRTPQAALASSAVKTGTWKGSDLPSQTVLLKARNHVSYIQRAGYAIYVKLTSTNQWALEKLMATYAPQGLVRRRQ